MKNEMAKMDNDWEGQNDCETLMKAEEIKADMKRLKNAMKHADKKEKSFKPLAELKDYAKNFYKMNKGSKLEVESEDEEDTAD